jgi:hypothetical protein
VRIIETNISSAVSGSPETTLTKYYQHQEHFRQFAARNQQEEPESALWRDGDIVNQSKILAFTKYWCRERRGKGNEEIVLKRESHKGIISALMDLYKQKDVGLNSYADPKTSNDLIKKFLDGVEREEQHIRVDRKEDAAGGSILDGFLTKEGLVVIANNFLISNSRFGHRNRLLALLSYALCTRSDNSTQIRLCDCSLLDLKAFDKHTDLPIALFEVCHGKTNQVMTPLSLPLLVSNRLCVVLMCALLMRTGGQA